MYVCWPMSWTSLHPSLNFPSGWQQHRANDVEDECIVQVLQAYLDKHKRRHSQQFAPTELRELVPTERTGSDSVSYVKLARFPSVTSAAPSPSWTWTPHLHLPSQTKVLGSIHILVGPSLQCCTGFGTFARLSNVDILQDVLLTLSCAVCATF